MRLWYGTALRCQSQFPVTILILAVRPPLLFLNMHLAPLVLPGLVLVGASSKSGFHFHQYLALFDLEPAVNLQARMT